MIDFQTAWSCIKIFYLDVGTRINMIMICKKANVSNVTLKTPCRCKHISPKTEINTRSFLPDKLEKQNSQTKLWPEVESPTEVYESCSNFHCLKKTQLHPKFVSVCVCYSIVRNNSVFWRCSYFHTWQRWQDSTGWSYTKNFGEICVCVYTVHVTWYSTRGIRGHWV